MNSRGARVTSAGPEPPATGACPAAGEAVGSRAESSRPPRPAGLLGVEGAEREGQPPPADSREETAKFAFKPAVLAVKCSMERTYENTRRELFRPSPEQIKGARAWLVRVVARRAVEILKARETPP